MGLRVNTNIASLNAQRNLANTTGRLSRSFERLSSGLRINRAADDAAGLAISEGFRAEIRSLQQAQRNSLDAISLVQIAEGALDESGQILIRMRELAIQAANGTLGTSERASLNLEFQDLIEPFETVQVSTSPVATATSVDALGEVAAVAEKFAKGRDAEVVKAKARNVGDVLTYEIELKGPVYHELLLLSINKGKLFRLSCISKNTRWDKRKELYKNVALSFVPQGF